LDDERGSVRGSRDYLPPANHAGLDDDALTTVVVRNGTWAD
jgi:hypothetical protein